MKNLNLHIVLVIIILNLVLAFQGTAQTTTSASYGNSFIHHDVEVVIHGYHNFEIGSLQVQPGVVGTERREPRGYVGFTNTSEFGGASDEAHIDGYVRFHGEGRKLLPLGDNGIYGPLGTDQKSGILGTSYFNTSAAIGITNMLNGENYPPLPEGGPYNIDNHGPDISFISDYEYWHIEGDAETKITLHYGYNSELEKLTNGNPNDLTIVGWNGDKWEVVPSKMIATSLGEDLNEGSIQTNDYINPSQYSLLTFGSLGTEVITLGNISGIAWNDYNGDGIKQNNEPPLSNTLLSLEECTLTRSKLSTTTDAEGRYNFENLEDGFYKIVFSKQDLEEGLDITVIPTDNVGGVSNDFMRSGETACLEIKFGSVYNSMDLGILSLGTIGDFVWEDINNNGLIDSNEPGIENIMINLMQGDSLISSTTSSANGAYNFANVYPSGNYYLSIEQSLIYDFTIYDANSNDQNNNDVDHSNGPGTTYTFEINSGQVNSNIDIGLATCNTITDYAWIDVDQNNIYNEGDYRQSDIQVNLYKSTDSKSILYATTITDGDGKYEFCVGTGDYYLEFILPVGPYDFATPFIGENDIIDSDVDDSNGEGTTRIFTVTGNEVVTGISAGLNVEDFVGTLVWHDRNRDGIRQVIEPGIENITIELYNSNHQLKGSEISNTDGRITFKNVEEGTYYLRAQSIEDYEFTIAFAGNDPSIDNNFDQSNGRNSSASFDVVKGYSNPNVDLGLMNDECLFEPLAYNLRMGAGGIQVIWETSNEDLISSYVVERRIPGSDEYLELKSYGPNGNDHQIYGYVDTEYTNGTTATYRIISYDIDGTACISNDKSINIPDADVVINIIEGEGFTVKTESNQDPCDIAPHKVYHKMINNQPQIIWLTSEESGINHFVLQRKLKFNNRYVSLDTIVSDNRPNQIYSKKDNSNLLSGEYYYRLVTYGKDGQECMSNIITVNIVEEELEIPIIEIAEEEEEEQNLTPVRTEAVYEVLLYPNPATDYTNLDVKVEGLTFIEVGIYDTEGKIIMTDVINGMVNDSKVTFEIPLYELKAGIYFVRTEINGKIFVRKLLKQDGSFSK